MAHQDDQSRNHSVPHHHEDRLPSEAKQQESGYRFRPIRQRGLTEELLPVQALEALEKEGFIGPEGHRFNDLDVHRAECQEDWQEWCLLPRTEVAEVKPWLTMDNAPGWVVTTAVACAHAWYQNQGIYVLDDNVGLLPMSQPLQPEFLRPWPEWGYCLEIPFASWERRQYLVTLNVDESTRQPCLLIWNLGVVGANRPQTLKDPVRVILAPGHSLESSVRRFGLWPVGMGRGEPSLRDRSIAVYELQRILYGLRAARTNKHKGPTRPAVCARVGGGERNPCGEKESFQVAGHKRNARVGPGRRWRREVWIKPHWRNGGPRLNPMIFGVELESRGGGLQGARAA